MEATPRYQVCDVTIKSIYEASFAFQTLLVPFYLLGGNSYSMACIEDSP